MTSSRGRRTNARARARRCRWPPERVVPRSPSWVSSAWGSAATKPSAWAIRSASQTCSSLTSSPRVTLSRTVSSKRKAVCGTSASWPASCPGARSRRFCPSTLHRALGGVDEPGEQRGERALPGSGLPHDRDGAAGLDLEAESVEEGRVGVRVGQVLDGQARALLVAGQPGVAVRRRDGLVEHRVHPSVADHRARELPQQPADRADREGDDGEQVRDRDEVARVRHDRCGSARRRRRARPGHRGWAGPRASGRTPRGSGRRGCRRRGAGAPWPRTSRSPRPRDPGS